MRAIVIQLVLCAYLVGPMQVYASDLVKDPLKYPLSQYGLMLGIAILGGLVSWIAKVKKGEIAAWSLLNLIGELATSAFAGLIAFWLCEAVGMSSIYTAPLVGIAGHMGPRAIAAFENFAQRRWGIAAEDKQP